MNKNVNNAEPLVPDIIDKEEDEIDLLELALRLVEKIKYIIALAVIGALVMGIYSFFIATPIYESTSKLYVVNSDDSAINLSDLQIGNYLASDYKEVFNIWEVQEMVLRNLKLDYSYVQLQKMIEVNNPSDTRILEITASSPDPQEAADLANEFAKVGQRYITEMMETDEPNILSIALKPKKASSPHKARNVILGFVIGAFAACAYFVVQFLLDDKIKNSDDITKCVKLPVLAVVPVNGEGDNGAAKRKKNRKDW